jgi:dTDP-glucose pyrophosphorylase
VVCFPAEIEKEKQTGTLYGYFVEDTNYYNVTALADESNKCIAEIGEVFAEKPARYPSDERIIGFYERNELKFIGIRVACKCGDGSA